MSAPFDIIAVMGSAPAAFVVAGTALRAWVRARRDTHIHVEVRREDGARVVLEYSGKETDANIALIQRLLEVKAKEEVAELEGSPQVRENEADEGGK